MTLDPVELLWDKMCRRVYHHRWGGRNLWRRTLRPNLLNGCIDRVALRACFRVLAAEERGATGGPCCSRNCF